MQSSKKYIHRFNNVSMLYADIKGFTELSTVLSAEQLVKTLNDLFAEFDRNAEKHGCLRIRILGKLVRQTVSGSFIPRGRLKAISKVRLDEKIVPFRSLYSIFRRALISPACLARKFRIGRLFRQLV
jgi:hypothetical protein